ncbi:MAG: hypothetical protein HF314_12130 [Ignavibacteria bacterium]|jgi:hypothetical protein|nr:hypothetical protein [Ignavibacteria bacterium]MCU7503819.1 hypothetical protein [Ignavibacteria bacterium]MCU7517167.1 hypothetical protein [Ignavibacteria bacterium]
MESLYFIIIWVVGLYIIRLNLTLRAYRKRFITPKKGIYVPSYTELTERKGIKSFAKL